MNLEIEILTALINSYERSKVSKGQNRVHKDIKLDVSNSVFDKHRNYDSGELEVTIQRIERDGYAKASYTKDGQFQCLILNVEQDSIDRLYKHIKKTNPRLLIDEYRTLFQNKINSCQIVSDFSKRMIELLDDKKLSSTSQYFSSKEDINDVCKAIEAMSLLEDDIQERVFCAKLFSDSKRFNDLRGKISKVIKDFSSEPFDDEDDVISRMGVIKNTAYAFIKGDMIIHLNNQEIDLGKYREPLALSNEAIKNISIKTVTADSLYTIENFTSFDIFNKKNSIVIYLGGFHNRVKRELIKKIHSTAPDIAYYHYGDIDAGGFYILNHLRSKTGIRFEAYKMGIDELVRYKANCKKLTENDKKRLQNMLDDPSFEEFKDTITYMLANNVKLEQEAEN